MVNNLDIHFYKYIYNDLKNYDDNFIYNHYFNNGIKEKRIPSREYFYYSFPNFNLDRYRNIIGLSDFNEFDSIKHYLYNNLINYDFYKYIYDDIKHLNNDELRRHYVENGIKEDRIGSIIDFYMIYNKFDIKKYTDTFIELNGKDEKYIIKHFLYNKFFYENLFKEFYYLLGVDYYYYDYIRMLNNNLINNFDLFYKTYPDFNEEEFKKKNDIKYSNKVQLFIYYMRNISVNKYICK
jgi:hypothetical protein